MPPTLFCFHPHGVFSQGFILNGSMNRELPMIVGLLAGECLNIAAKYACFLGGYDIYVMHDVSKLLYNADAASLQPNGLQQIIKLCAVHALL